MSVEILKWFYKLFVSKEENTLWYQVEKKSNLGSRLFFPMQSGWGANSECRDRSKCDIVASRDSLIQSLDQGILENLKQKCFASETFVDEIADLMNTDEQQETYLNTLHIKKKLHLQFW